MKKSVFTILNYLLPPKRVMPMHCSANVGRKRRRGDLFRAFRHGQDDALRRCVAHAGGRRRAWLVENGVFNFEGGCYAKVIKLSRSGAGDLRHDAAFRHRARKRGDGSGTRELDLDDGRYTENTRAAYPIDYIPNASRTGTAPHPKNVIMLTADAFGVLPPISKLTPSQTMYHFLSGFTAKVAGTEKGSARSRSRPSRPASARRSCRVIRPNTAICCAI